MKDEADAVRIANDTSFGWAPTSGRRTRSRRCAWPTGLETGMVYINAVLADSPELPFGGTKGSGTGRELGAVGIEEFINKKLIYGG